LFGATDINNNCKENKRKPSKRNGQAIDYNNFQKCGNRTPMTLKKHIVLTHQKLN